MFNGFLFHDHHSSHTVVVFQHFCCGSVHDDATPACIHASHNSFKFSELRNIMQTFIFKIQQKLFLLHPLFLGLALAWFKLVPDVYLL